MDRMKRGAYTELFNDVFTLFKTTARADRGKPDFDKLAIGGSELSQKWQGAPQGKLCLDLLAAVYAECERLGGL